MREKERKRERESAWKERKVRTDDEKRICHALKNSDIQLDRWLIDFSATQVSGRFCGSEDSGRARLAFFFVEAIFQRRQRADRVFFIRQFRRGPGTLQPAGKLGDDGLGGGGGGGAGLRFIRRWHH